ncbi:MAG: cell division protein FtsZ, partial [Chitinophagaceae bacterium]
MIHFDLPKEKSSIIKVIGIGGGGSNAVNHMFNQNIEGVNFIICNTDSQAIANSPVPNKIQLGPHLTQGLGAGANPEIGKQATEESFEEIKKILEVNTKMAFITAGMGGGTGTGGAPIVARICRELGILTVGIITTPFPYEGKKRLLQAEEGINNLKEHVDTLLIISNDKLRHQFGNLPFKAAFAKADNIVATAAKCITDVINQHGHINVDFADVCTAMRNGGVAILGSAAAEGDNRAQKAIEEALASPLLNDNNIQGAKWILLNINSAEGEFEHTIDEMDTIQAYIQSQAGDDCDVILGVGYDNSLGSKIGVTIIATGFEQKSIRSAAIQTKSAPRDSVKIVMQLGKENEEKKMTREPAMPIEPENSMSPWLGQVPLNQEASPENMKEAEKSSDQTSPFLPADKNEWVLHPEVTDHQNLTGGFLSKPEHIYAEFNGPVKETPPPVISELQEMETIPEMSLVIREDLQDNIFSQRPVEQINIEETDEQKRKSAERLVKLRSISFNVKSIETSQELEMVPAYIRRNINILENEQHLPDIF